MAEQRNKIGRAAEFIPLTGEQQGNAQVQIGCGRIRGTAQAEEAGATASGLSSTSRGEGEVAELLRPVPVDQSGTWIADYVRLCFRANLPI